MFYALVGLAVGVRDHSFLGHPSSRLDARSGSPTRRRNVVSLLESSFTEHDNASEGRAAVLEVSSVQSLRRHDTHQSTSPKFTDVDGDGLSEDRFLPKGCYLVQEMYKGLSGDEPAPSYESADMTLEKCYYHCVEHRSIYFLVQNGKKCSCIDRQVTCEGDFEKLASDSCNVSCSGDLDQKCGGEESHSVFLNAVWMKKVVSKSCGPPPPVAFAKKTCESSTGGGCEIVCEEGYVTQANNLLCDSTLGKWVGLAKCTAILCHAPPAVAFALSTCSHSKVPNGQDKCEVTCLKGYELVTNTLTCAMVSSQDFIGQYTGEARCEAKKCGDPPVVENGLVPLSPVSFPYFAQFHCKIGYSIDGSATGLTSFSLQCGAEGKFEENDRECKPILCGPAPQLEGALSKKQGDVYFPQEILYDCEKGFSTDSSPTGATTLSVPCQANGMFPDPLPECVPVVCGSPLAIMFAKRIEISSPWKKVKSTEEIELLAYEESATYECDEGHTTDGKKTSPENVVFTVTCEHGFRGVDACMPIQCGKVPELPNSIAHMAFAVFGEKVHYACEQGHSLDGSADAPREYFLSCLTDATYTEAPGCKPMLCGKAPRFEFAEIAMEAGKNVVFPEQVSYKCAKGYSTDRTNVEGKKIFIVSCQDNGQFSVAPLCVQIDDCIGHTCGPFGHCVDKMMDYTCECEKGYEEQVVANEKICGNIDDCGPEACGAGECKDLVDDYECICPEGYEQKDVDDEHTCTKKICGAGPVVSFATRPLSKAVFGDRVKYICDVGHTRSGRSNGEKEFWIECLASAEFTPAKPCKAVYCGEPPQIPHAKRESGLPRSFSEMTEYTCEAGHSTDGTPSMESKSFKSACMETGQFSEAKRCMPILCGPPQVMANTVLASSTPVHFPNEITYECVEGFTVDGTVSGAISIKSSCAADGTFRKEFDGCLAIKCGKPPEVEFARTEVENETYFPTAVSYTCDNGYSVDGTALGDTTISRACESTGWEGPELCKPVSCGAPPSIENGETEDGAERVFGDSVNFQCRNGFTTDSGSAAFALTCEENGQYSVPPLCFNIDDCIGNTCGAHGQCVDKIEGFECVCEPGFEVTEQGGKPYCGNVDDCGDHQCGEHGVCVDQIEGYSCSCSLGYVLTEVDAEHKTCAPRDCGPPPSLKNGKTEHKGASHLLFPMMASYTCERGHSIDGTTLSTAQGFNVRCEGNGQLVGMKTSECVPVQCGPPPSIDNAQLVDSSIVDAVFGNKLSYKCMKGHTRNGKGDGRNAFSIKCRASGQFDHADGCARVSCGTPPHASKATYSDAIAFYTNVVTYRCDVGYSLDGAKDNDRFEVACKEDGTFEEKPWTGDGCAPLKCGAPPPVANADKAGPEGDLVYGQAVTYTCKEGFSPDSKPSPVAASWTIKCTDAATFETGLQCVPIVFAVLGRVKDATTGVGIPGTEVILSTSDRGTEASASETSGAEVILSNRDGAEATWKSTTNEAGVFEFQNVHGGNLKMQAAIEGYVSSSNALLVTSDIEVGTSADRALSPVLPPDGWRVIVNWKQNPTDLDSHLVWASPFNCHIYYSRTMQECGDGVYAALDLDDTSSFGPETVTISHVGKGKNKCTEEMHNAKQCQITYKVHNYSKNPRSFDGGKVSLYNGDKLVKEFVAGTDGIIEGAWWKVLTIDTYDSKVVPVE